MTARGKICRETCNLHNESFVITYRGHISWRIHVGDGPKVIEMVRKEPRRIQTLACVGAHGTVQAYQCRDEILPKKHHFVLRLGTKSHNAVVNSLLPREISAPNPVAVPRARWFRIMPCRMRFWPRQRALAGLAQLRSSFWLIIVQGVSR